MKGKAHRARLIGSASRGAWPWARHVPFNSWSKNPAAAMAERVAQVRLTIIDTDDQIRL